MFWFELEIWFELVQSTGALGSNPWAHPKFKKLRSAWKMRAKEKRARVVVGFSVGGANAGILIRGGLFG